MGWLRRPMENYRGRHVGCAPGTHATIASLIKQYVPIKGPVLDLGAHSGALLLRLKDIGFTDLTGADLDPTRFDVPGANFKRIQLNERFAGHINKQFNLIVATDVIEHLDSPRDFLKEVRSLLINDGFLALSLPNVASWQGRIKFLIQGELWGFGEKNYRLQRHISPITHQQMTSMMQEIGFRLVKTGAAGSFSTGLMKAFTFPIWGPSVVLLGAPTMGECAIFLAQKADPNVELAVPTHYRNRWQGIPDKYGLAD